MNDNQIPLLLFSILILGLLVYWRYALDWQAIDVYLRRNKQSTLVKLRWAPFGPGWWETKSAKIYRIVYRDAQGKQFRAFAIPMLDTVYLTMEREMDERITRLPPK